MMTTALALLYRKLIVTNTGRRLNTYRHTQKTLTAFFKAVYFLQSSLRHFEGTGGDARI